MSQSYLNRIIAIDNISRGQFVDIPASKHTNFNGVIRAGKTTTLRAALLFYGTRPGDIAKAKGDAFEGFATFYFPNPTSYIVFEYVKNDNIYCVVCTKNNSQVQYQFLDTLFDQKHFLHQSGSKTMIATYAQLKVTVEAKGFEFTPRIGADTYAKIIQSSKPYREKGANADLIRKLRPKYALPAYGYSIDNIDRVLANIFASKASVANIRSALTNILIQENAIQSSELRLDENTGHISVWFDKREAWIDVDNRKDKVQQLGASAYSYKSCREKLSGLYARIQELKVSTDKKIQENNELSQKTTATHHEVARERREHNQSSSETTITLQTEIRKLQNEIDDLEAIKNDFVNGTTDGTKTEKTIQELITLFNSLSTKDAAERDAKEFYDKVVSGHRNIIEQYDQQRTRIEQIKARCETDAGNLKSAQLETRQQLFDELHDTYAKKIEMTKSFWESRLQKVTTDINAISKKKTEYEVRLEGISLLPSFIESIETYQKDLNQSKRDELDTHAELASFKDRLNKIQLDQNKLINDRRSCHETVFALIEEQTSLKARIGDGTLFDYLTENVNDFEATIGKVISPKLLSMKNLDPLFETSTNSMFGLKLDLSSIEDPEFGDVDSIKTKVIALDLSIADHEQKRETIDTQLSSLNDEITQLKKDIARTEFNKKTAQRLSNETNVALKQEKENAQIELEARKEELAASISNTQEKLNEAYTTKNSVEKEQKQATDKVKSEFESAKSQIVESHEKALSLIQAELTLKLRQQDESLLSLNEQEKRDVEAGGFSAETLEKARNDKALAGRELSQARVAGERVGRYNRFMETKWPSHSELVNKIQLKQATLIEHQEASQEMQSQFSTQIQELESQITSIQDGLKRFHKSMTSISELIQKFINLDVRPNDKFIGPYKSIDVSESTIRLNSLMKNIEDLRSEGTSYFNDIKGTFQRKMGTPTFEYYERLLAEQSLLHPTVDLWWACAPSLLEYLDGDHLSQANLLRSDYQLVAQSITEFSEKISSTHQQLNALGKRLTASMKGIAAPFEAIGELDLSVSSNLRSLDYFSALEDFRVAHEDWRMHHDTDLPGERLISKLSSLVDMLGTKTLVVDVERSFKFEVTLIEDGKAKKAKTDDEIENISSNGTSYIIILALYIGLINMIRRPESGVQLQFCIDELGRVDTASSGKLIEILDQQNIKMFSALPMESADLLQHYPNCYMIVAKSANQREYRLFGDDSKTPIKDKLTNVLQEQ